MPRQEHRARPRPAQCRQARYSVPEPPGLLPRLKFFEKMAKLLHIDLQNTAICNSVSSRSRIVIRCQL
jgi:hypothetical protein